MSGNSEPPIALAEEETQLDMPEDATTEEPKKQVLGVFEKYLSIWVLACMAFGVAIGHPKKLEEAKVAEVNIPIAVLLWGMILPMMIQIDFTSLHKVWLSPKGIILTSGINYLIQPFTMYGLARLFFEVIFKKQLNEDKIKQYIAGAVILGGSPCTAMVFAWSALVNGNPAYTLTQVAVNDLLILILYSPTLKLLLDVYVDIPWLTLLAAVAIFVLVPLVFGVIIRIVIIKLKGLDFLNEQVLPRTKPITIVCLLLTLVLIFLFQSQNIVKNWLDILMIAVPLIIQTFVIWMLAYGLGFLIRLPFSIAAPGSLIAASNFFELAVAVTISLYGPDDGSVLATTVGVLTEVPVMLILVFICNRTKKYFKKL